MKSLKENKYYLIYILVLIPICISAICNYWRIYENNFYFRFFYFSNQNFNWYLNVIYFSVFVLAAFFSYLKIIDNPEFEQRHMYYILIISILYALILPIISSDVYYYIGTGWQQLKYFGNPYYESINSLANFKTDEMLKFVCWNDMKAAYGPVWMIISKILISFSNGNLVIGLFIFKIFNLIVHLSNCHLIYKVTNNKKYMYAYGLNPFVLFEGLTNVHNDTIIVTFVLISLYFLYKDKFVPSIIFLTLSILAKYITVILVPYYLIYIIKRQKSFNIIKYLGIMMIIASLLFLPYVRDFKVLDGLLKEGNRYSQSLQFSLTVMNREFTNLKIIVSYLCSSIVILVMLYFVIKMIKLKDISISLFNNTILIVLFFFIFVYMKNLKGWYMLWLIPFTLFSYDQFKFFIRISLAVMISNFIYIIYVGDYWELGILIYLVFTSPFWIKHIYKICYVKLL